jgi:hypothetical protein
MIRFWKAPKGPNDCKVSGKAVIIYQQDTHDKQDKEIYKSYKFIQSICTFHKLCMDGNMDDRIYKKIALFFK